MMGDATRAPGESPRDRHFRFGDFTLDLDRGRLCQGEKELSLRPKVFDVLTRLVRHHGRIVGKTELIQTVWPDAVVTDNSLAQCLLEIRRALDDDAQQVVRTVAKRGYIFDLPVVVDGNVADDAVHSGESAGVSAIAAADIDGRRAVTAVSWTRPSRAWAAITALVVGALAGAVIAQRWPTSASTNQPPQLARFSVIPPGRWTPPLMIALSPDGRHLAFVATDAAGATMLWVRD